MNERELELRRVFLGKVRQKLPKIMLVSLPMLLACLVLFGGSNILVGLAVYVAVMVGLAAFLGLFGYFWWHYHLMPVLRRSEAARAAIAERQGSGTQDPGGHLV